MSNKYKSYSPDEKLAAIKSHLLEGKKISTICEELSISPTLFHTWKKIFFDNGAVVFERKKPSLAKKIKKQEDEFKKVVDEKNEVIAELLGEHVQLKKHLGVT